MSRLERIIKAAVEEYYNTLKEPRPVNVRVDFWKYRPDGPVKVTCNLAVVSEDVWDRDFDSIEDTLLFMQEQILAEGE